MPAQSIMVYLSKPSIEVGCHIEREDTTTAQWGIESVTMRGAQREITTRLRGRGYQPAGRWVLTGGEIECFRAYRPGPGAEPA